MPNGRKVIDFKTGRELGSGESPTRVSFAGRPRYRGTIPLMAEQPTPEAPYPAMGIPPTWGEPVTWDVPRTVTLPSGETIDALIKPDKTVWRGGEQIGTIDEYGRFAVTPPTAWEQFGEAFQQIGMGAVTGLGYLFKPFEMFHEYAAVPFAMGVTAPAWAEGKPLEAEDPLDFLREWFSKEGKFRKAYHEWEAPKYLRGTIETLPWFLLPMIGQVGRAGMAARGLAGKVGQISPQLGKALEYSPYGLMEKAFGKVVQYPIKVGGKVVRRLTVTRDITIPEPTAVEELLASVAREHPERLRPTAILGKPIVTTAQREKFRLSREAETTFKKVEVLRNEDRLLKESSVPSTLSLLMSKGDEVTLFGLKEMPIPGTKFTHELVTAPWIKPRVKGASMALDDVLANPSRYEWSGLRGKQARLWAEQYYEIQNSLTRFWATNIQRPIGKKAGEQYVHSIVTAQRDLTTGATILEKQLYPAGTRGGISGAAKPLKFKTEIEGIKAGYKYGRPSQALAMQVEEYYNMTTFKRAMSLIDDLFQDPMERMNKEIADTMRQYIRDIKFLGGGITKYTTKEGKVILEKHPGVKALIQSVRRGEVPTAGMVKAVERRFPELGVALRDALEIRYLEFEPALKGISEAILKDTKITRDKFREVLTTVRAKRAEKIPAGAAREGEEVMGLQMELEGLQEWIASEPAAALRTLIKKTGWYKGEVKNLTLKGYKDLTGKDPLPNILTKDKKHVRWEYALDDKATEMGYKSGDELKEAIEQAGRSFARIEQLKGEIARAEPIVREVRAVGAGKNVTAGELTETLDTLGIEAGKQVRFLSQLYRAAYKEANVEREAALKQLRKSVDGQIVRLKAESKAFAPQFKLAREQAIKAAFSEGRIISLAGYANKIIPDKTEWGMTGKEISDRLMKILTPDKVNVALRTAGRMARMGVTLTAALDLSLIFIQGGLVLGHDVARWAAFKKSDAFFNMTKEMVKAIWNPKYQDEFMAKNFALMKEMAENRAVIQKAVEYMRPQDIENLMRKGGSVGGFFGGVFKQTYGRFGAGFGSGSLAARTTIYKQMREAWLREGHSLTELGEFVNKVTGVISSAELGVSATQRAIESAGLFAPNYTRAYIMVARDLFRGNKTASEVRKALAGMMAGGVIAYVGLSEMVGQEPKLNPAPKALGGDGAEFMSFKIGESIIGLPGFWYSAIRMIAAVTAAAEQDPERLLSLDWRENDFLRFWMGRSSPMVAVGREVIEGKDFLGRNLDQPEDWMRTIGVHFLTIAAQNLITRDPSEEEGKYKRFGAEIFGVRTFPRGDWRRLEDMENEYSQREFQKPFDDLNREDKDTLLDKYPEYKALSQDARDKMVWESGEDFEQWLLATENMADAEYHAVGEQLARALFAGQLDYRTYLDEESTLRKIYQGKAKERQLIESLADPEQAERWAKWAEERPPEDQALDKYWEIRSALRRKPTGEIDWDDTERRVEAYLTTLDSDTRTYILRMRDRRLRKLPPMMQKIARIQSEGREVVDEYYDQPEGKERVKYRRINPTIDAWLLIMGRVSVPRTEMAMQLAMEMLQQRGLPPTLIAALAEGTMPTGAMPTTTAARPTGRPRVKWL